MKNSKIPRISPAKRLLYAIVGLLAGDLILLFFLLQHALHATILAGAPARALPDAVETFILYAIFSLVGWMLVGLPATLLFPARSITSLSWPRALIVGATVGPIALVVIFALLSRSHIYFHNFAEISTLFAYTILVSTVSFMVYLALLRRKLRAIQPGHNTSSIEHSEVAARLLKASAQRGDGSSRSDGHDCQSSWS